MPTGGTLKPLDRNSIPAIGDCVHCGLCIPSCPTHHATGREADSPRGRIAALRALDEGRQQLTDALHDGLENCLVCRACESACPSGISMENLMGEYRQFSRAHRGDLASRFESWILRKIFCSRRRLDLSLSTVALLAPLLRWLPGSDDLPAKRRLRRPPPEPQVLEPTASLKGSVALLRGCVADRLFARETSLAARLLAASGWRVHSVDSGCCGALQRHAGLLELSDDLSRKTLEELRRSQPDHIVVDSSGCGAHLAEPRNPDAVNTTTGARITDSISILLASGLPPLPHRLPGVWALAEPCHQKHSTLDGDPITQAMKLALENPPVTIPGADHCCGAAGFYLLRRKKLSQQIGREALRRFETTGADGVISANPGCLLRWEGLLGPQRVLSPIAVLARAAGIEGWSTDRQSMG